MFFRAQWKGCIFIAVLLVFAICPGVFCDTRDPRRTSAALEFISVSNNQFSKKYFAGLLANQPTRSTLVTSPLSTFIALGMLAPGASGNTEVQIKSALTLIHNEQLIQQGYRQFNNAFKLQGDNNTLIKLASRLYVARGFKINNAYLRVMRKVFKVKPDVVDFRSKGTVPRINTWVERHTENKIKDLVKPGSVGKETMALMINALYLKAAWQKPFMVIPDSPFHLEDGTTVNAPFMKVSGFFKSGHQASLNATIVQIPYENELVSFVVVLPDFGVPLEILERSMKTENMDQLLDTATMQSLQIFMPKFRAESSFQLKQTLMSMGMIEMFGPGADLTNLAERPEEGSRLFVSDVSQKVFIDVHENGTEAAAATVVEIQSRMLVFRDDFMINRPFLFYVLHHTIPGRSSVLFVGRYLGPLQ